MLKNTTIEVVCNMCGKSYDIEDSFSCQIHSEEGFPVDFYHVIELKQPGYPSVYDLTDFEDIHLCDDCFDEFIESLKFKPKMHHKY